jgi:hypothetical protein
MKELWVGIAIGAGSVLVVSIVVIVSGFLRTLFQLPKLVQSVRSGVECLLDGQMKHTQVTSKVIEVQQASLEFIRDNRNNGNITSALEQNAKAKADCEDILVGTQEFLVEKFAGEKA